ncbi:glycogen synthase GlgA [Radiobacillus sp. PE A8.2]|uniref:glycogen synthase GlgA n=1 Tax=Radiobacillus sp. PE A8.2 TaxID=3380349 RepID=UPI0038902AA9
MNIVFIASESVPFVKTGGLADVIGSLPEALQAEGHRVQVFLPKYKSIPSHFQEQMHTVVKDEIKLGWRNQYCGVEALRHAGINYYFIDNLYYFGREGVYGYSDDIDEAERFIFFCKAILEMMPKLIMEPDVIHVHDWQTALIPLLIRNHYGNQPYYEKVKTVFTIHNLKYQGIFSNELVGDIIELPHDWFHAGGIEYYGKVNLLKGGIAYADAITTVSPTYAEEIQTPFFGEGLDGLLRTRKDQLSGIINGLSLLEYDTTTDPYLYKRYYDQEGKAINKKAVQEQLYLPVTDAPMITIISRLVEQKGLDLVIHVLDELLQEDIQFVVLGTGEHKYEHTLNEFAKRYPEKFHLHRTYNEELSRNLYAGSDFLLMPSLFEPCGLSQLIALRYGTIPIVRETGGLNDTILSFNEELNSGNGFTFKNYNAHDLLFTIRRALLFYHDKVKWAQIHTNARSSSVGWAKSATMYDELYQELVGKIKE